MAGAPDKQARPHVSLLGEVNEQAVIALLDGLREPAGDGDVIVEITSPGGDAEMARRMVLEVDLARERLAPRRLVFLGKTIVYSAATTLMSAFPREDRWLTADAMVMIHCRQLDKDLNLSGPIRASLPKVEALRAQLKTGIELETEHFERLISGSDVTMDELLEKGLHNWYLTAREVLDRGLVAGIV